MAEDLIIVERPGSWSVVTLNRPERLNSFNGAMHLRLAAVLDALAADDGCRAVLLTGAGRGFCAGHDLSDRDGAPGDTPPDLGDIIEQFYNPLIRRLRAIPKPVVCAVNGVAAGAGANIALSCDIVLAARSARFIQSFSRIGLVPDSGGTFILPRLVGEARARGLTLLGEPLSAEQAESWGLIWRAVDDIDLATESRALTARLGDGPTQGLAMIKLALQASDRNDLDRQLDLERDMQRRAGATPDHAEGLRAFATKRQPNFTGARGRDR